MTKRPSPNPVLDPTISLAFSMFSGKGIYALLLGSGASRSAGIPTGWEVIQDLIRKVAALFGDECGLDPVAWYSDRFGSLPDYSKLLDGLGRSPAERHKLLRGYFEANEEERERGVKIPTAGHRAIADLVAKGYIRVVVTTNFDRLLETAIEAAGVVPQVISTPDAVKGASPLQHTACTILKVNGDYLDTRMRNTVTELEKYDTQTRRLLDRIFDEYGLVVCGWSGEWDLALRTALENCPSKRFTLFWATRGEPSHQASKLITSRMGEEIRIENADSFFKELAEKVAALEDIARPHPLTAKAAVATVKRQLADARFRIELHDLFSLETERLVGQITGEAFSPAVQYSAQELAARVSRYETVAETLLGLMVTGAYWARDEQVYLLTKTVERLANYSRPISGLSTWIDLQRYPALLLTYAGGVAALTADNYFALAALLILPTAVGINGTDPRPLVRAVVPERILPRDVAVDLPGRNRQRVPVSEQLFLCLRDPLSDVLPSDDAYDAAFDEFEAFFALVIADLGTREAGGYEPFVWAPYGRFAYKRKYAFEPGNSPLRRIRQQAERYGAGAGPCGAGFFAGVQERLLFSWTNLIRMSCHNGYPGCCSETGTCVPAQAHQASSFLMSDEKGL